MNTHDDLEASRLAQLGNFSKLPVELRLMIWDFLIFEDTKVPQSQPVANILRSSRYVHREISQRILHDFQHKLYIQHQRQPGWIEVKTFWGKLECSWMLKNENTLRHYLRALVEAKASPTTLEVYINSAEKYDAGRIIDSWNKGNTLVRVLNEFSPADIPSVQVRLIGHWIDGKDLRVNVFDERGNNPWPEVQYDCELADFETVLLPFTKLPNWMFSFPSELERTISQFIVENGPGILYQLWDDTLRWTPEWDHVDGPLHTGTAVSEQWHVNARFMIENRLDSVQGETGNLLRRERFMNWFPDGANIKETCKSAYEEQYWGDVIKYPRLAYLHDPGFADLTRRHLILVYEHENLIPKSTQQVSENTHPEDNDNLSSNSVPYLCPNWDHRAWILGRPEGILPLGHIYTNHFGETAEYISWCMWHESLKNFFYKIKHWNSQWAMR
ncbi:hypothetical protein N7540_010134 [Penicillium herquei]|nr:hypothetical protein N7540_010134 [Penicillium herquei]